MNTEPANNKSPLEELTQTVSNLHDIVGSLLVTKERLEFSIYGKDNEVNKESQTKPNGCLITDIDFIKNIICDLENINSFLNTL